MKRKSLGLLVLFAFLLILPTLASAKTEVIWWHAMGGFLGERVNEIAQNLTPVRRTTR